MKVSCRKAFTSALLDAAHDDPRVFAIATDSRGSVTLDTFAASLPAQFIELGIAEQNAVSFAAGLASTGRTVFVAGPACFLAGRAFEQIKVDVAYNKSNVKIIGVSSGVSYGPLGGTHTALHDFSSLRALPNIEIFTPADAVAAQKITEYLVNSGRPAYMRTGRGDVEAVYNGTNAPDFTPGPGSAHLVHGESGKPVDLTIIASGEMVYEAKRAAELLKDEGRNIVVIDMWCQKPLDEYTIAECVGFSGAIMTVEEHSVHGGLGEAVSHVAARRPLPVPVKILGFPDEEYMVGKNSELFAYYGLDAAGIVKSAREMME